MSLMNNKMLRKWQNMRSDDTENHDQSSDQKQKERLVEAYSKLFRTFESEVLGRAMKIQETSNSLTLMYQERKKFIQSLFEEMSKTIVSLQKSIEEELELVYRKYTDIISALKADITICLDGVFKIKRDFRLNCQPTNSKLSSSSFYPVLAQYSRTLMDLKERFCEDRVQFVRLLNFEHDLSKTSFKRKINFGLERLIYSIGRTQSLGSSNSLLTEGDISEQGLTKRGPCNPLSEF